MVLSSLFVLWQADKSLATGGSGGVSAAAAIRSLNEVIRPVLERATEWSTTVALGLVSANAFYALVVRLTKL